MPNPASRRAALVGVPALLGAVVAAVLTVGAAPSLADPAQTRYVATTGSDGTSPVNDCTVAAAPCRTIQHAVDQADAGDTVSVARGSYAESVTITKSLTVSGAGRGATTVGGAGGNPSVQVQPSSNDDSGPAVVLQHLGLSGNSQAPGVAAFFATVSVLDSDVDADTDAGIYALFADVRVSQSTASRTVYDDNSEGAPFALGAGIVVVLGNAEVDHTSTTGNVASGIELIGEPLLPTTVRAAITRSLAPDAPPAATLSLTRSTVARNGVGGVLDAGGVETLTADTVSANVAAGVVSFGGTTGITDSTITGTVPAAASGGDEQAGVVLLPDLSAPGVLGSALRRSASASSAASLQRVLAAHPAAVRRAARTLAPAAPPPADTAVVTVSGSIDAAQRGLPDCYGTPVDGGYDLSSDTANSCRFSATHHDQIRTDPMLGTLADNGGATRTQLPQKGSPAIDAIPVGRVGCAAASTDQRDDARVQPTAGRCDVGAVELAATAIAIHPSTLPDGTVGKAYSAVVTATGGAYSTYSWALASGTLPNGLRFTAAGRLGGTPTKAGTFTFTVAVNDPVLRTYTVVIAAAAPTTTAPPPPAPAGNGNEPIASTGARVGPLLLTGSLAVLLGLLLMAAGSLGRRRVARHRAA